MTLLFPKTEWDTENFRLRLPRSADVEDVAYARSDPLTRRYLAHLREPYTLDDAREYLSGPFVTAWQDGRAQWVVADRETDRLLGVVRVPRATDGTVELGCWFAPWGRGRGACAESTEAATAFLFEHGAARAELVVADSNIPSQRAALRAGFRREGILRSGMSLGAPVNGESPAAGRCDAVLYSRLPEDEPGPTRRLFPDLPSGELSDGVMVVRPTDASDVDHYLTHHSLPAVRRDSELAEPPVREVVEQLCGYRFASQWLAGEAVNVTILEASRLQRVGYVSLSVGLGPRGEALLDCSLDSEFRNEGVALRAVQQIAGWAFRDAGFTRLRSVTAPENSAAQGLLKLSGFKREGYARESRPGRDGVREDGILYALLPGDL